MSSRTVPPSIWIRVCHLQAEILKLISQGYSHCPTGFELSIYIYGYDRKISKSDAQKQPQIDFYGHDYDEEEDEQMEQDEPEEVKQLADQFNKIDLSQDDDNEMQRNIKFGEQPPPISTKPFELPPLIPKSKEDEERRVKKETQELLRQEEVKRIRQEGEKQAQIEKEQARAKAELDQQRSKLHREQEEGKIPLNEQKTGVVQHQAREEDFESPESKWLSVGYKHDVSLRPQPITIDAEVFGNKRTILKALRSGEVLVKDGITISMHDDKLKAVFQVDQDKRIVRNLYRWYVAKENKPALDVFTQLLLEVASNGTDEEVTLYPSVELNFYTTQPHTKDAEWSASPVQDLGHAQGDRYLYKPPLVVQFLTLKYVGRYHIEGWTGYASGYVRVAKRNADTPAIYVQGPKDTIWECAYAKTQFEREHRRLCIFK